MTTPDTCEHMAEIFELIPSRINSTYNAVIGLFNFQDQLLAAKADGENVQIELQIIEQQLANSLYILAEFNGINSVANQLHMEGAVRSRGKVFRAVAGAYDQVDVERFPHVDVSLIGIVGKIASGKGTVGNIISDNYKSMHFALSDRLREYATARGHQPPHSRDHLREVNDELKPRFGKEVFVNWTIAIAQRNADIYHQDAISIDGFRSLEEALFFKEQGGVLIAIEASADTRYQRVLDRKRGADDFSRDSFDRSDEIERAWINPIIDISDVVIANEDTEEDLAKQVLNYLKSLGLTEKRYT